MRSLHADLQAAQDLVNQTPYVALVFTNPDGTITKDYSSDSGALLTVEHTEEPYNAYATIILKNEDDAIVDVTGYWVEIGWGYNTTSGNRSSGISRLWVKRQMELSAEGQKMVILELEDMWTMMAEQLIRIGDPPLYANPNWGKSVKTPYGIIELVLAEVSDTNYTFSIAAIGTQDDGIIDTFVPVFDINTMNEFEDAASLVRRLILMTKCFLRSKAGLEFEVIFPQDSDTADVTFYSDQVPYFTEYLERNNIIIPNHYVVFANKNMLTDEWEASTIITAEASIQEQIDKYRDVTEPVLAATITTQTDADNRADALGTKARAELLTGRLVIPMHTGLELCDRVTIVDNRMATS